jgi:hypothetical protein
MSVNETTVENAGAIPQPQAEKKKARPKPIQVDWEPVRQLADDVIVTGYGASLMMYERLSELAQQAHEKGTGNREEAGPLAKFFLDMFTLPKKARKARPSTKVPVLPIADYDSLTVSQVAERFEGLTEEQLKIVRQYEVEHKNRKGVLQAIDQRLAGDQD